ncbi:MAG: SDR family oxidoreductase [Deltaproteobacteria bacterium]|nr:SDR family oxidoreductase [Deltaproteobacteria bacterium]
MNPLSGRVALVTGGSRGIGAAIARRLSSMGLRVAIVGRSRAQLEAVASEIGAVPILSNVAERGSAEAILAGVKSTLGEVDVLVPNAGVDASFKLSDTTDEVWDQVMATNVGSVFALCRAAIPGMIARGRGRVVVIASTAGLAGYPYTAAYCASKHAAVGLVRAIAAEIARSQVTINAICPGFVDTEMAARSVDRIADKTGVGRDGAKAALERMSPQGRLIKAEEVAHAVAALLPDEARGIHGQAVVVNGGGTFG